MTEIRFDLKKSVESNFNMYQDAIAENPASSSALRVLYNQYLKTLSLYQREQKDDNDVEIVFDHLSSETSPS